jgi:hypothetical protein
MSKHFTQKEEIERTTRFSYLVSPTRPMSAGEARFRYHGYFRAAVMMGLLFYFIYCNPEYSYTYTALRSELGWDKEKPMFPQYLKRQPSVLPTNSPFTPPRQE